MAVPGFQDTMLPLLQLLGHGQTVSIGSLIPQLADVMGLSAEEKAELLPSGKQERFANRVHWGGTYLVKSGLLERPERGQLRITEKGRSVLSEGPSRIDLNYLTRYPEIVEFRSKAPDPIDDTGSSDDQLTPEESIEQGYQSLRAQLASDLLERLVSGSPKFFEQVVVDLLVGMGYGGSRGGVAQAIGRSGDEGIDGIINEDKLGLDVVYIQAKRWAAPVGRPVVQGFTGSLEGQRATKGVLITTSVFTSEARTFVKQIGKRIVLIDGEQLAELMIDHDVGVSPSSTYTIKRVDNDYFEEL